jgi:hypothetical protein
MKIEAKTRLQAASLDFLNPAVRKANEKFVKQLFQAGKFKSLGFTLDGVHIKFRGYLGGKITLKKKADEAHKTLKALGFDSRWKDSHYKGVAKSDKSSPLVVHELEVTNATSPFFVVDIFPKAE